MQIQPHEIAFDFDGVVADTFRLFTRIARDDYGVDINYDDITHYEFIKVVNMDKRIAGKIIDAITYHSHELDLRPYEKAIDVLGNLAAIDPLLVVTARPESEPVRLWFEKHLPGVEPTIIATGESTAKLEVLQQHNVGFFIDDRLDTGQILSTAGMR